jgi:hypothetical protein
VITSKDEEQQLLEAASEGNKQKLRREKATPE